MTPATGTLDARTAVCARLASSPVLVCVCDTVCIAVCYMCGMWCMVCQAERKAKEAKKRHELTIRTCKDLRAQLAQSHAAIASEVRHFAGTVVPLWRPPSTLRREAISCVLPPLAH